MVSSKDSLRQDSLAQPDNYDSNYAAYWKNIQEPNLRDTNLVAYRYVYGRPFSNILHIYTVIQDSNKMILNSKIVAGLYPSDEDSSIVYEYGGFFVKRDTILYQTKQELTHAQYNHFVGILNGSYFWALKGEEINGFSCSADNLSLEYCHPSSDSTVYYRVSINNPLRGSFNDACLYLAEISELKQSREVIKYLTKK